MFISFLFSSVPVSFLLEGSVLGNADVVGLLLAEFGELGVEGGEMEAGDLLVKLLGEDVDLSTLVLLVVTVGPELDLGEHLVGERARHDERGMSGGAAQVQETALSEDDNSMVIGELVAVDLLLDVDAFDAGVAVETVHVDLVVEMSDVADDGVVLHLGHVVGHDDSLVSGGGNEDITGLDDGLESLDLVSFHSSLEGADGVDLNDDNTGALSLHGLGASLADITESADDDLLTGNHNIGGAHKTIGKRVTASVHVIELLLGDAVVDVDALEAELSLEGHLVEAGNTGGGLLGHSLKVVEHVSPLLGVSVLELTLDDSEHLLHLAVVGALGVGDGSVLLELELVLLTLVHEESGITTVIDKDIGTGAVGPGEHFECALPVFLEGLVFPREDVGGLGLGNGGGSVVLGGVDVA